MKHTIYIYIYIYIYPKLDATPLNDQQQLRLNKINEIKEYFLAGIKERELMCKRLSKYIPPGTILMSLLVLSVTTGSISIVSFEALIGAPVGIVSASFSFAFSLFTGIVKKLSKQQEIKRKSTISKVKKVE